MQGKARTQDQKTKLFNKIEPYLKKGLSLRKACEVTQVPYTSMRDIMESDLLLRTKMSITQHELLSLAWKNVRNNIEKGDVKTSQWYIEKVGTAEPLTDSCFLEQRKLIRIVSTHIRLATQDKLKAI